MFEGGRGQESRGHQVRDCCRRSSRQTETGYHLGRLKYRDIVKVDSWAGIADLESCWSVGNRCHWGFQTCPTKKK
jgi:hypothetical protein